MGSFLRKNSANDSTLSKMPLGMQRSPLIHLYDPMICLKFLSRKVMSSFAESLADLFCSGVNSPNFGGGGGGGGSGCSMKK